MDFSLANKCAMLRNPEMFINTLRFKGEGLVVCCGKEQIWQKSKTVNDEIMKLPMVTALLSLWHSTQYWKEGASYTSFKLLVFGARWHLCWAAHVWVGAQTVMATSKQLVPSMTGSKSPTIGLLILNHVFVHSKGLRGRPLRVPCRLITSHNTAIRRSMGEHF